MDLLPNDRRRWARPVDPRLLEVTRGTRRFLVLTVLLGSFTALLIVIQAWLLASMISDAIVRHEGLDALRVPAALLVATICARAVVAWLGERVADKSSASAKSDLRLALVEKVSRLGPAAIEQERAGRLAVLASSGIDALDAYFARYLPQVVLALIIPVAVTIIVLRVDLISAAIIAATVPLIPIFMMLVGSSTRERVSRQAHLLQQLAGHFLDVVAGLPTLKIFGRAKAQATAIRDITNRYREATMATLKVAFVSSLILELLATISVALVAVAVGLRLLGGHVSLRAALFVLILAPEAYLPLRSLAANYHASAEGMRASEEVFEILERPLAPPGPRTGAPRPANSRIVVEDVVVRYPMRELPALSQVAFVLEPGEVVAITGPSGCGKSTLLSVLLAMAPAWTGSVTVDGVDLAEIDPDAWRRRIAWVPQRTHLFSRTIEENVQLGSPDASAAAVHEAIDAAGLADVVARLPSRASTPLGPDGAGLSAGERQRVALARAFLRDAELLLLDEPTANLDGRTEQSVLASVRHLLVGRTALIVAHRPSLLSLADRVVALPQATSLR